MVSKLKIILSFSITAVALVVLFLFAVNTGSLKVTPIELFKGLFIFIQRKCSDHFRSPFSAYLYCNFGWSSHRSFRRTAASCDEKIRWLTRELSALAQEPV